MKAFFKNYLGFIIGLVFGSVVATLTTYSIFHDPSSIAEIFALEKCLLEELSRYNK